MLAHEFGHFLAAKSSGVRVDEFGLGFPPKIFGKKLGETEYSLNWLPIGGFVKIFGETVDDETQNGPDQGRSLTHKPKMVQAWVLVAGAFFNLLLAWLLFSVGFISGLPTSVQTASAELSGKKLLITGVMPESPALRAGLAVKDELVYLQVGSNKIDNLTTDKVRTFISSHGNEKVVVGYRRNSNPWQLEDEAVKTVGITPQSGTTGGPSVIGIAMDEVGIMKLPVHLAIIEGAKYTGQLFWLTVKSFGNLIVGVFHDGKSALGAVTGPIGLVGMVGDARHLGLAYLLGFTALISVNLAVINLVPFPALDGGRLLLLAIEAIRRKPLKPEVANWLNATGFFLLIGLMVLVSYRDILNLFWR